jgi:hypothetical protein
LDNTTSLYNAGSPVILISIWSAASDQPASYRRGGYRAVSSVPFVPSIGQQENQAAQ